MNEQKVSLNFVLDSLSYPVPSASQRYLLKRGDVQVLCVFALPSLGLSLKMWVCAEPDSVSARTFRSQAAER